MLSKKKISAWLIVFLLVTQWAYSFGFGLNSQAYASGGGSSIQENLITSVTLAVYTDDKYTTTVTDSVYELDSYSELNYTWALANIEGKDSGTSDIKVIAFPSDMNLSISSTPTAKDWM